MTDHLPDCDDYAFSGAGFHPNCERICICRQVRRVEDRVLKEARDAVAAQHLRTDDGQILRQGGDWEHAVDRALAAIDALRDQPADQTGYNLPDGP